MDPIIFRKLTTELPHSQHNAKKIKPPSLVTLDWFPVCHYRETIPLRACQNKGCVKLTLEKTITDLHNK